MNFLILLAISLTTRVRVKRIQVPLTQRFFALQNIVCSRRLTLRKLNSAVKALLTTSRQLSLVVNHKPCAQLQSKTTLSPSCANLNWSARNIRDSEFRSHDKKMRVKRVGPVRCRCL